MDFQSAVRWLQTRVALFETLQMGHTMFYFTCWTTSFSKTLSFSLQIKVFSLVSNIATSEV